MTIAADGQLKYVRMSVEGECGGPHPFRDGKRGGRTALRNSAVDGRGVTLVGIGAISIGGCGGGRTEDIIIAGSYRRFTGPRECGAQYFNK